MAIQNWLRLDQSAAANCDEDIMLVTTAGFRQMWCPEHVEGGSRGRMWGGQQNDASEERGSGRWLLISQQNDGTCSFLQAGPRIWGHWRQSIERGKQGRFGQKQIYLDQKIWDFDFVLECLRTALLWSSGKGQARKGKGWQSRRKASKLKTLPWAYTKFGYPPSHHLPTRKSHYPQD